VFQNGDDWMCVDYTSTTGVIRDVTKITIQFDLSYDREIFIRDFVIYACISAGKCSNPCMCRIIDCKIVLHNVEESPPLFNHLSALKYSNSFRNANVRVNVEKADFPHFTLKLSDCKRNVWLIMTTHRTNPKNGENWSSTSCNYVPKKSTIKNKKNK